MSSELGLDDAPPGRPTTPVHELRVRTISGDLEIVRARGRRRLGAASLLVGEVLGEE